LLGVWSFGVGLGFGFCFGFVVRFRVGIGVGLGFGFGLDILSFVLGFLVGLRFLGGSLARFLSAVDVDVDARAVVLAVCRRRVFLLADVEVDIEVAAFGIRGRLRDVVVVFQTGESVAVPGDHVLDRLVVGLRRDLVDRRLVHAALALVRLVDFARDARYLGIVQELGRVLRAVDPNTVDGDDALVRFDRSLVLDVVVLERGPVVTVVVRVETDAVHRELLGNLLRQTHRDRFVSIGGDFETDRRDGELLRLEPLADGHAVQTRLYLRIKVDLATHGPPFPDHDYKRNGPSAGSRLPERTLGRSEDSRELSRGEPFSITGRPG